MPKVSVIIPVYNAEESIVKTVETLVYGEYKDIEICLVEDCGKDNSFEVCKNLAEQFDNVRVFRNEKNRGVSFTRNHGLQEARGEYIVFVDSDDWVSGKYIARLVETLEQHPSSLPICGSHFIDELNKTKRDFLWDDEGDHITTLELSGAFKLIEKYYIQQLWNKIFRKSIIEGANIQFDINQSMGEDFQFVLDYLETGKIENFVLINAPLYYYTRTKEDSLMSTFGKTDITYDENRLIKLKNIAGNTDPQVKKAYDDALCDIKSSSIYHVSRSKISAEEKLKIISRIMPEVDPSKCYSEQKKIMKKERLAKTINSIVEKERAVKNKAKKISEVDYSKKITAKEFTIISQNCVGGMFYHDMKMEFLSPTINVFFMANHFSKFVDNLHYYIEKTPIMKWEEYPIGTIEDIDIHFLHAKTVSQALLEWERRKKRIIWDKIIVISTDRDGFNDELFEKWKDIKYPKILFTANKKYALPGESIYYPQYENQGETSSLIDGKEYHKDNILIEKINSLFSAG